MKQYHVAVESVPDSSIMSMMGGGFGISYFTATFDNEDPVNAQSLYELINKDREHKTGNVIAWSRIE